MRHALAALLLWSLPQGACAYIWEGIWAADPAWCQWADQIGSHDPAPIRLTSVDFDGYENSCTVQRIFRISMDAEGWQIETVCHSEGDSFSETTWLLMASPDKLWRWQGLGDPVALYRCGEM